MFFNSPAYVKSTSFMHYSYNDHRDDDQWLYLPVLKKVKRISGGSKDDYFMGPDFTYEDMEKRNPNKDSHKLLTNETLEGETCYGIESTPKEDTKYSKRIAWVIKTSVWADVQIIGAYTWDDKPVNHITPIPTPDVGLLIKLFN